ncbi:MAG: hypothetical protein J5I47_06915 [Vicingus serpentipes]|nr:hypothetical protein [Vicingus serpentipes]
MSFVAFIKKKSIWIICTLSFLSALFYNELNIHQLDNNQLRANETIITNDDASYLNPPTNYLNTKQWKDNSIGKQSYFIRPPGYGIFYFLFLKTTGFPLALKGLKITQLLLFSASIYWLFFIVFNLTKNKTIALASAAGYGLMPFSIGFLYYTLTEGITPALLLLYIFLLLKGYLNKTDLLKNTFYLIASFVFAFLLITRPQLGFFGLLIPIVIIKDYWTISLKKAALLTVIFSVMGVSFYGAWQYRNYKITNQILGTHPIYYADGNSFFRPSLKAYWKFVGGWAQEGATAYSYMVPMWQAAIKGDTSITHINKALTTFPPKVIHHFGKEKLIYAFRKYQKSVLYQKPYFEQQLPMPEQLSAIETETIEAFNDLTKEYKNNFWWDYHFIAPLAVFKKLAFHSNLSLHIFQHTYRGDLLMEVIRWISFLLHSSLFIVMLFRLFLFKNKKTIAYFINLICFAYVFYLCYFQRGIEERYTLPMLPLLIVGFFEFYQNNNILIYLNKKLWSKSI